MQRSFLARLHSFHILNSLAATCRKIGERSVCPRIPVPPKKRSSISTRCARSWRNPRFMCEARIEEPRKVPRKEAIAARLSRIAGSPQERRLLPHDGVIKGTFFRSLLARLPIIYR